VAAESKHSICYTRNDFYTIEALYKANFVDDFNHNWKSDFLTNKTRPQLLNLLHRKWCTVVKCSEETSISGAYNSYSAAHMALQCQNNNTYYHTIASLNAPRRTHNSTCCDGPDLAMQLVKAVLRLLHILLLSQLHGSRFLNGLWNKKCAVTIFHFVKQHCSFDIYI
jgi:hypothetical protein